ncbi:MAG TPA: hypothetical protein VIF37_02115 [Methylobacter sp.]|jgi:outer membrane protein assembly factor BamD (BamD/ComL family)
MGMNSVSASSAAISGAGRWQQQRQNFNQLSQALQSGNLDAAKQAFSALAAKSPTAVADPNSPLGKLAQALQSGDIGAAQQAFSALRSGHHHHRDQDAASQSATPSLATSGSVGTNINTVA